jgi:hypothetical protein
MWINKLRHAALAAGLALAAAGCAGENAFGDTPFGVGQAAIAGTIRGQVTANGVGVGNATVSVANGPSATTDGTGEFRIPGLAGGRYTLSLQVPPGFNLAPGQQTTQTVELGAGRSATVTWRLQPVVATP